VRNAKVLCTLACACFLLIISCATTKQVKVWKDDSYQGKLKKILVIGVSQLPLMRNFFESEFVDQLKTRGVEGVVSNKIIPPEKMRDKEAVLSAIKGMGIEAVLVTRVVDKKYADQFYGGGVALVPTGYDVGWDSIYAQSFAATPLPVYQHSVDIVMLQTNVYDIQKEKLIFSAISKTYIEGAKESVVKPFIESMVKELAGDKLL
jgi:hypothetical protein